ncbi:MAG: class I SAM-dependent methyltransferase [Thermoplasmata archaeon]
MTQKVIDGINFPNYTHISRLGSATAIDAIKEGIRFYKLCKPYLNNKTESSIYVDFGCGTGRIFRIFMKDFHRENMIGVDVIDEFIKICKKDFDGYNFTLIPYRPPTHLESNSIDFITAYSVFSHFGPLQGLRWIKEFARILRPGGFAFLTTSGKAVINLVKFKDVNELRNDHKYIRRLLELIGKFEEAEEIFDKGEILFFPGTAKDYNPFDYGVAFVSPGFIKRLWGEYFNLIDYIDDYEKLEQAFIVLQKK